MIEPARVLVPLDEATDAIDRLVLYESPAELAEALKATGAAVDRSLRLLLRADTGAPESLRMSALSSVDVPFSRVLDALRQRDMISLELAGKAHDLTQALARAERGDVRAADADLARATVAELRREVHGDAGRPVAAVAHHVVETGELEEPAHAVPPPSGQRRRWIVGLGVLVLLAAAGAAVWWLFGRGDPAGDAAVAYREGRLGVAEQGFKQALGKDSSDVLSLLYLGRIYIQQKRLQDAANVLQKATDEAPNDADVRRERGHYYMALGRPDLAAPEFQRAVDLQPGEKVNWIGWIRALRAANDPRVDEVIRRAPPDVQALLSGTAPPTTTQP